MVSLFRMRRPKRPQGQHASFLSRKSHNVVLTQSHGRTRHESLLLTFGNHHGLHSIGSSCWVCRIRREIRHSSHRLLQCLRSRILNEGTCRTLDSDLCFFKCSGVTSAMNKIVGAFIVTFENHPPPTSKHSPVCLLLSWTSIVTIGATWAGSSKLRISGDKRFSVIFDFATGTTQFTKTLFFS